MADTHLDNSFHHAHHLVDDGDDLVRALRGADVGPVLAGHDETARHVQHVGGREFEMHGGAVGVVDDGGQEGILGCKRGLWERRGRLFL